ncbi:unnamed protein product [Closterium sp. Naga37s-1]|nr:unnamed protein product [Closterium sp. Naga37s-1]
MAGRLLKAKVFLVDETFEEVEYDESKTAADILENVASRIGLGEFKRFGLFEHRRCTNDSTEVFSNDYTGIDEGARMADIMAALMSSTESSERQVERRLMLRKRSFRDGEEAIMDPLFIRLCYLQARQEYEEGIYPTPLDLVAQLAALHLVLDLGLLPESEAALIGQAQVEQRIPVEFRPMKEQREWHTDVLTRYNALVHFIRPSPKEYIVSVELRNIMKVNSSPPALFFTFRMARVPHVYQFKSAQGEGIWLAIEMHINDVLDRRFARRQNTLGESSGRGGAAGEGGSALELRLRAERDHLAARLAVAEQQLEEIRAAGAQPSEEVEEKEAQWGNWQEIMKELQELREMKVEMERNRVEDVEVIQRQGKRIAELEEMVQRNRDFNMVEGEWAEDMKGKIRGEGQGMGQQHCHVSTGNNMSLLNDARTQALESQRKAVQEELKTVGGGIEEQAQAAAGEHSKSLLSHSQPPVCTCRHVIMAPFRPYGLQQKDSLRCTPQSGRAEEHVVAPPLTTPCTPLPAPTPVPGVSEGEMNLPVPTAPHAPTKGRLERVERVLHVVEDDLQSRDAMLQEVTADRDRLQGQLNGVVERQRSAAQELDDMVQQLIGMTEREREKRKAAEAKLQARGR